MLWVETETCEPTILCAKAGLGVDHRGGEERSISRRILKSELSGHPAGPSTATNLTLKRLL